MLFPIIHLLKGCLPITKEQLQTCILSYFSVFQESDCNRKISKFPTIISPWLQVCIYWNAVCYWTASVVDIHFYYDIHWNTVCYMTASVVNIHIYYNIYGNTVCYLTTSIVDIHFYYDIYSNTHCFLTTSIVDIHIFTMMLSLFDRGSRSDSFCHRYCVYLATVFTAFAAIYQIKQTMFA